jgi:hypothetical protein
MKSGGIFGSGTLKKAQNYRSENREKYISFFLEFSTGCGNC